MLDKITYNTDPVECLDIEKVETILENCEKDYNASCNKVVKEPIEKEILSGGLDKFSLNIMGEAPANALALETINVLDEIKADFSKIKAKIIEEATTQRSEELNKILEKIEEEIIIETKEKLTKTNIRTTHQKNLSNVTGNDLIYLNKTITILTNEISLLDKSIKTLEEKKKNIIALLSNLKKVED